jgi:hypothetical protein
MGAPARPEPGREAQHEYATLHGARRRLSFRAGLAVVLPIAEILAREPPTLHQVWLQHVHAAQVWKPKPPPPPKPSKPAEPQLAWTGEGWAQVPAFVPAAPQPSTGAVWLYRGSMAWACVHLTLHAAILLLTWITARAPRTLVVAGLAWLVFWVLL